MPEFLTWLEASLLGRAIRGSGVWTYAVINTAHVLSVASLFGSILVLDLRLLGLWRRVSLAPIAIVSSQIAGIAFVAAAATGACLLAVNGSEYIGNPWLLLKFPAIAVGFANALLVRRSAGWQALGARDLTSDELRRLTLIGGVSLAAWLTALVAGRMIAYW